MRLGYSLPEIEEHFKDLLSHREREVVNKHLVPMGGEMKEFDVFQVPLELPRYRLDNTRTLHLQKKYVAEKNLNSDYFETDVWLDELQNAQHIILSPLTERKGLKSYFEKTVQTEPLILTHDGFVISGNRRLCAYRELYFNTEQGRKKYKHFERVRVVILPRCTEEEIEFIEDYLEQQPDIKDDFSWVSKAMGFKRRMQKHGYTTQVLSDKSNIKKQEIEGLLENLSLAEEYLKYIRKESEFERIEKDKYAFEQIEKCRKKFKHDSVKRDLFEKLSFVALQHQDKISGRMYSNIPIIQEHLESIEDEIKDEFSSELEEIDNENNEDNPLDELIEEDNNGSLATLRLIKEDDNREQVFDILFDKVTEIKAATEEKNRKRAVLKKIQKANSLLVEANNYKSHETDKAGIQEQIEQIEKSLEEIKNWAIQ